MYLSKVIIVNYRSCRFVEVDLMKDEPNILIGINDCGKTSLLKALELLLFEKPQIFCEKDGAKKKDISNTPVEVAEFSARINTLGISVPHYSGKEIVVIGQFIVEELDYSNPEMADLKSHSLWALENAADDGLWLCRAFEADGKARNYLLTPDVMLNEEQEAFFHLTAAQLNKKRKELAVSDEDIHNSNGQGRFSNLEIVRALYTKTGCEKVWTEWRWEKPLLPSFRYLDWNSSFDNILESAAEALKDLIEEHLTPVKVTAREKAQMAQEALNERLKGHRNNIASLLPQVQDLTAQLHFEVKEKITDLLITKLGGDGPVHMDLQGDGIKRQIWFALIKAAAIENNVETRKRFIWAFDEPETHLYPTAQRQLFEIIKDISNGAIQTLISTHSTVFIDKASLAAIKILSQENSYTIHSQCEAIDNVFHSLEMRNSDFLFHDRFLVVEGETEEYLIPALYKLYAGRSLQMDNIQLIRLKGASNWPVKKAAIEAVFENFRKPTESIIYLFDFDQKGEVGESAITPNMLFVGKQDLEDSLPNEVWAAIASEVCAGKITFNADDIQALKETIPSGKCAKHEKFWHILTKALRERQKDLELDVIATIPTKGYELATAILQHLTTKELIPSKIAECFEKLSLTNETLVAVNSDGVLEESLI